MPRFAVVFFILAIAALIAGFAGTLAGAAGIARPMFFLFLFFAAVSLVLVTSGTPATGVEHYGNERND